MCHFKCWVRTLHRNNLWKVQPNHIYFQMDLVRKIVVALVVICYTSAVLQLFALASLLPMSNILHNLFQLKSILRPEISHSSSDLNRSLITLYFHFSDHDVKPSYFVAIVKTYHRSESLSFSSAQTKWCDFYAARKQSRIGIRGTIQLSGYSKFLCHPLMCFIVARIISHKQTNKRKRKKRRDHKAKSIRTHTLRILNKRRWFASFLLASLSSFAFSFRLVSNRFGLNENLRTSSHQHPNATSTEANTYFLRIIYCRLFSVYSTRLDCGALCASSSSSKKKRRDNDFAQSDKRRLRQTQISHNGWATTTSGMCDIIRRRV